MAVVEAAVVGRTALPVVLARLVELAGVPVVGRAGLVETDQNPQRLILLLLVSQEPLVR
jgi:hypothetical protein